MNADIHNSGPGSGATSPSGHALDSDSSESEFLTRESELTKIALARTLDDLKSSLRTSADLRVWTRRHPWAAIGVAAAAGFTAATVVAARRDDGSSDSGENGDRRNEVPREPATARNGSSKPLASAIFSSLFDLAKVALQSSIAASASMHAQQPSGPPAEQPVNEEVAAN